MAVNRAGFQKFLKRCALSDPARSMVPGAMEDLKPLFEIAKSGKYPLAALAELEAERNQIAADIALATDDAVAKVEFVSLSTGVHQAACANVLSVSFRADLWADLYSVLKSTIGDDHLNDLKNSLKDRLMTGMKELLENTLGASGWRDTAVYSVWAGVFFFVGFAIAGNSEQVARLRPIVCRLPRMIPFGERKDEPNTYLVLCA